MNENIISQCHKLVQLIISDYDGTLVDGKMYGPEQAIDLIKRILMSGKDCAVITARGVTGRKVIELPFLDFFSKEKITSRMFLGIGNGTILYELTSKGSKTIYSHSLTEKEIQTMVDIGIDVYKTMSLTIDDLQPKGITTFQEFIHQDWSGYISSSIIPLFQPYNGMVFAEEAKVSFVLPKDELKQQQVIRRLEKGITEKIPMKAAAFQVKRGDTTYVHITHTFDVDPKLFAVRTIMKILKVADKQVAVFGDMPEDNDKGMLVDSGLPFTFANGISSVEPPYLLEHSSKDPVQAVYQTIKIMI